jgi:flagellar biosynthesis protein FliQ
MSDAAIFDMVRETLWTAFLVCLPVLAAALVTGLAIGLVQALTSVQEATLTFVPKLGAILIVTWIAMGFMTATLLDFFHDAIIPAIRGI